MNDVKEVVPDVDINMEIKTVLNATMEQLLGEEGDGMHSLAINIVYKQFLRSPDGELTEMQVPLVQSLMAMTHGVVSILRSVSEQPMVSDEADPKRATLHALGASFCNMLMEQIRELEEDEDIQNAELFDGFDISDEVKQQLESTSHLWRNKKS